MNNDDQYNQIITSLKSAIPENAPSHLAEKACLVGLQALKADNHKHIFTRIALPLAAAFLILISAWIFITLHKPALKSQADCGGCWNFVGYDAANSRHSSSTCAPTSLLWQTSVDNPSGAYKPLAWKNLIIAGMWPTNSRIGGSIVAYSTINGNVLWKLDFNQGDMYKSRRFPDRCIHKRTLYVTDGDVCHVIDPLTGKPLDDITPPLPDDGWSYLTADEGKLFGASRDGRMLFGMDAISKKTIWTRKLDSPIFIPALLKGVLYCHEQSGTSRAINLIDGRDLWQNTSVGINAKAGVHAYNNNILVLGQDDSLALIDSKTGALKWKTGGPGYYNTGLALGDSAVYLKGGTLALSMNNGSIIWDNAGSGIVLCAAPTLIKENLISTSGLGGGKLGVLSLSGDKVSSLNFNDNGVCDGAITSGGQIYTVGSGRVVAFSCGYGG